MKNYLIIFALLFSTQTWGQDDIDYNSSTRMDHAFPTRYSDIGLITGASFKGKGKGNTNLGINYQLRMDEDITEFQAFMLETSLRRKFGRFLSLRGATRFTLSDDGAGIRGGLAAYFKWKKKGFPIRAQFRTRIEHEMPGSDDRFTNWRNRLKVEWNMSKVLDPYVSYEVFNTGRDPGFIDIERGEFGLTWKLNSSIDLVTFFRVESYKDLIQIDYGRCGTGWHHRPCPAYWGNARIHQLGLMLDVTF